MFSDELREGTLHAHTGLEKKLVAHIKKINQVSDYIQLLKLMYGYYKPLQQKLSAFLPQNHHHHFSVRSVDKILDDIAQLDGSPSGIPFCSNTPEVNSDAASLGALYVTEGSTLGGQIITKMISKKLDIDRSKGFSFFNSYGDDTPVMWEKFKAVLNAPRQQHEKNEMMATAIQTFSTFKTWIDDNER